MAETQVDASRAADAGVETSRRKGWFAAGGVIGALLASSCCIIPLVLVMLGVSGAWIGNFAALEPYKAWFVAATLVFLALGFWQVYFRRQPKCEDDAYCARPETALITKGALWIATVLVAMAITIRWWAPLLY